jgi:hypothetical protein
MTSMERETGTALSVADVAQTAATLAGPRISGLRIDREVPTTVA